MAHCLGATSVEPDAGLREVHHLATARGIRPRWEHCEALLVANHKPPGEQGLSRLTDFPCLRTPATRVPAVSAGHAIALRRDP
jgi:hypothetical protein